MYTIDQSSDESLTPTTPFFRLKSEEEMRNGATEDATWLWDGFLKPHNVTLLTAQWKSGKTTLVSVLLSKLSGAEPFMGLPIRSGRAVVITEEPESNWRDRLLNFDYGNRVRWLCRPFDGQPRPEQWQALIDFLAVDHRAQPFELLVIDPLASFLPGNSENLASSMFAALMPLQALTKRGVSVFIPHHPKKGESAPGQASRGSGALTGFVDIIVEMDWYGRPFEDDRRRRLSAWSRHQQTPRRMLIELNAAGTDYIVHGDYSDACLDSGYGVLFMVLEDASNKLTRWDIQDAWPNDHAKPADRTIREWLDRAVKDGRILREGTGRKNQPFQYWLPGQEELWKCDIYHLELPPLDDPVEKVKERIKAELREKRKKKGK